MTTQGIREFLSTSGGKITGTVFVLIALVVAYYAIRSNVGNELTAFTNDQVYICSETMKEFKYTPKLGDKYPAISPYSGKATGFPAETCYWNKDGSVKKNPTYVLLNSYRGDPSPTFCPDCGRLVVAHNPFPQSGMNPPPIQSEYKAGRRPEGE